MKTKLPFILMMLFIFTLITGPAFGQGHTYSYGQKLTYSDGTDLNPGYYSSNNIISVPCVADWNGDGKKDLIVGYFYQGWVYVFINEGTNSQPLFVKGNEILLAADGTTISVAYG